jgi:hypothetical protein
MNRFSWFIYERFLSDAIVLIKWVTLKSSSSERKEVITKMSLRKRLGKLFLYSFFGEKQSLFKIIKSCLYLVFLMKDNMWNWYYPF